MRGPLSRAGEIYNYVEVGLWPAMGVIVAAVALRRRGAARTRGLIAAVTLVAFGASDATCSANIMNSAKTPPARSNTPKTLP